MSHTAEPLALRLDGREVASYVWEPSLPTTVSPRPFLHPVRTLAGTAVTELMPDDHRHHLGVSVAVADVGGANFWGGRTYVRAVGSVHLPNHGAQRHHRWERRDGAAAVHELRWTRADGTDLLGERRRIAARPHTDRSWLLDFAFELTNLTDEPVAIASPAVNGRPGAGYGGFFWRAVGGGPSVRVLGPDRCGEDRLHGTRTSWIALSASGKTPWTLIFLTAAGPAGPDPWFVRSGDYVGVGSALAWAEPLLAEPGQGPSRRIITVVADGALGPEEAAAMAETALADR